MRFERMNVLNGPEKNYVMFSTKLSSKLSYDHSSGANVQCTMYISLSIYHSTFHTSYS